MQRNKEEKKAGDKITIQEENEHPKNAKIHKKQNINDTPNLEINRF